MTVAEAMHHTFKAVQRINLFAAFEERNDEGTRRARFFETLSMREYFDNILTCKWIKQDKLCFQKRK